MHISKDTIMRTAHNSPARPIRLEARALVSSLGTRDFKGSHTIPIITPLSRTPQPSFRSSQLAFHVAGVPKVECPKEGAGVAPPTASVALCDDSCGVRGRQRADKRIGHRTQH